MSMPGWYPDPAGNPGHFRYWDGSAWSPDTTTDPSRAQPAAAPGGQPPRQGWGRGGLLALVAALLVLALLVWALFFRGHATPTVPEDSNSATPTGPVWNEKDSPTPSATGSTAPAPSNGALTQCPDQGGNLLPQGGDRLSSAGLSVQRINGWDYPPSFGLKAIRDVQVQLLVVYDGPVTGWLSGQAVGRLAQGDGFRDPRTSAYQVMSCFASSGYYQNFTARRDLTSQAVTISGHKGWRLRSEIRVSSPDLPNIDGDRMDIIVLDTGQAGSLAVYAGWATIGDTEREALVDQAITTLSVG